MQKNGGFPCKNNTIFLLSTTLGRWCHFPRVGNLFLANGCSKSSMVSMVKLNVTRRNLWQKVSPKLIYNETFAPITKRKSIYCTLVLVAIDDMRHQKDIKTTFFNCDIERRFIQYDPKDSHKKDANILCVCFPSPCMV